MGRLDNVILIEIGGKKAAEALLANEVDFATFVTSPHTPWVRTVLTSKRVTLAEPSYTSFLVRVLRFTTEIILPERVLDFKRRVPSKEMKVLGVATSLVVTPSAHPAIKQLILSKAHEIINRGSNTWNTWKFPSTKLIDHPLDAEAVRFFQHGPTPIRRYLPYWFANIVERFWILLLPMLTIIIPILGFGPTTLNWNMRRRIYRSYRELASIEQAADMAARREDLQQALMDLNTLQARVKAVNVTLPYRRELYALRAHIAMVKQSIIASTRDNGAKDVNDPHAAD